MAIPTIIYSKSMNHLGLLAGMFKQLGIGETIDKAIPNDNRIIRTSNAVKAMVLNGLGFVSQPLYLAPAFFKDKPVSELFDASITAEHLNDDALGDALDAIADYGPSLLYSHIASHAVKQLDLEITSGHLDSTSFHVDGKYDVESSESTIKITKGYSRDHRPDLNQVVVNMISSSVSGIPLLMETASGNSSDKINFHHIIKTHTKNLNKHYGINLFVADSALYTTDNLSLFKDGDSLFITRVPETLKEAKDAITKAMNTQLEKLDDNYSYCQLSSTYGGVEQQWYVIKSEHAKARAAHSVTKQFAKKSDAEYKLIVKLKSEVFSCRQDAKKRLSQIQKKLSLAKYDQLTISSKANYKGKGRPQKDQSPDFTTYHITGEIYFDKESYDQMIEQKSYFILATNSGDYEAKTILKLYKEQGSVERGFRFYKSPEFFTSSLNLKSPKRIMALMMIMTVCLLVYAALEHQIRLNLQAHKKQIISQTNKMTGLPTARWVFHVFKGIHVIYFEGGLRQMMNINQEHLTILSVLGQNYEKYYESQ